MPDRKRPIRRVACVGEVMIELVATGPDTARIGVAGDTYNTAVYLARALGGDGPRVDYVTALGEDPYSERIMAAIRAWGIGTGLIERRAGLTPGLYAIETDAQGERRFSYWRSASAARTLFAPPCAVPLEALDAADMVYLSGITLAILPPDTRARVLDWARRFTAQGGTLAFDGNDRPQLWDSRQAAREITDAFWRIADIALPSLDDEEALSGLKGSAAVLARLKALGVTHGALKRGAAGPVDLATGQPLDGVTAVSPVIDSTAAGDSFNAAYLAAHILGGNDIEALRAGHDLACRVIAHPGAILPE